MGYIQVTFWSWKILLHCAVSRSNIMFNVSKVSKHRVISGPYFSAFGLNTDQKQLRIWTLMTQCLHKKILLDRDYRDLFYKDIWCLGLQNYSRNYLMFFQFVIKRVFGVVWSPCFITLLFLPCFEVDKQPPDVFYKRGVLKNVAKIREKHLCWSLVFHNISCCRPSTLFKKRLWHRCFHVNFAKFSGTSFLKNFSGRPPLEVGLKCEVYSLPLMSQNFIKCHVWGFVEQLLICFFLNARWIFFLATFIIVFIMAANSKNNKSEVFYFPAFHLFGKTFATL